MTYQQYNNIIPYSSSTFSKERYRLSVFVYVCGLTDSETFLPTELRINTKANRSKTCFYFLKSSYMFWTSCFAAEVRRVVVDFFLRTHRGATSVAWVGGVFAWSGVCDKMVVGRTVLRSRTTILGSCNRCGVAGSPLRLMCAGLEDRLGSKMPGGTARSLSVSCCF